MFVSLEAGTNREIRHAFISREGDGEGGVQ